MEDIEGIERGTEVSDIDSDMEGAKEEKYTTADSRVAMNAQKRASALHKNRSSSSDNLKVVLTVDTSERMLTNH
jgi:hypothetical protein